MAPVIIVPGNNTVRSIGSHVWMALGLLAGLALGLAAVWTRSPVLLAATQSLRPLGTLFLNLLSMVVIPLVATALFAGVAGLGDLRRVGRLGIRTLAFFWAMSLAAILIGFVVAALLLPLAPIGIFAIVASALSQFDVTLIVDLIRAVAVFIVAVIAGLAALIALVLLPVVALVARLGPGRYLRAIRASLLMAFSTTSSLATLPVMLEAAESDLRIPGTVASFVLPLGASVGRVGSALFQAVAVMFVARLYGVPLGLAGTFQAGAPLFPGALPVVQLALRHVDRVRRAPPSVASALVRGTRVARAGHLIPLHAIEVTPQAGARLDPRPPSTVDRGRRERHCTGRSEGIQAA